MDDEIKVSRNIFDLNIHKRIVKAWMRMWYYFFTWLWHFNEILASSNSSVAASVYPPSALEATKRRHATLERPIAPLKPPAA